MGLISLERRTRKPGPAPANRRCAAPDCITVLSRYNPGDRCHAHTAPAPVARLDLAQPDPGLREAA